MSLLLNSTIRNVFRGGVMGVTTPHYGNNFDFSAIIVPVTLFKNNNPLFLKSWIPSCTM